MRHHTVKLPPKRLAWEAELGRRGLLNPASHLSFLKVFAEQLNGLGDEPGWQDAAAIVTEPQLSRAIGAFNRMAAPVPFSLQVGETAEHETYSVRRGKGVRKLSGPRRPISMLVGPQTQEALAARYVWDWFGDPERRRLKRCPDCETWFVDVTRPRNSQRCSKKCTWRAWNRRRALPAKARRASRRRS